MLAADDLDTLPAPIEQARGEEVTSADYEEVLADKRRLTRELDVLLNGDGAAKQAALCDIVAQVEVAVRKLGRPLLSAPSLEDARDAARYRWLREHLDYALYDHFRDYNYTYRHGEELDAAIDEARSKP